MVTTPSPQTSAPNGLPYGIYRFRLIGAIVTSHRYFREHRHTGLLIAIVLAFGIRPAIGNHRSAELLYSLAVILLLLVALYTTQIDDLVGERVKLVASRKKRRKVAWILAALVATERIAFAVAPGSQLEAATTISSLFFFSYITFILLRNLTRHKEVTTDTISMSVAVYLLLGVCWGLLYIVIFHFQHDAFNFGTAHESIFGEGGAQNVVPILIYFSLTTLGTVGYGDITPLTLQARYAAVAEGITGQFYLAVLVARLVGLYMQNQQAEPPVEEA